MQTQTMQQMRAGFALEKIKSEAGSIEILSYASAMPAMILMDGLGQTAAFYK